MSSETFNKSNLDEVLQELAKEYRKLGGKNMPAEIILIGGAAIIENYGFRDMTTDVDAIIYASSIMKDAINRVGDRLHLPNGWLNDDFKKTKSYSIHLSEVSVHYKSLYGVLNIRTVSAEYLIAMKLNSGRQYKNDLSDIVGILAEHKRYGNDIKYEQIDNAIKKLYGGWDQIPDHSISFIKEIIKNGNYESIYDVIRNSEKEVKEVLIDIEKTECIDEKNIDQILSDCNKSKAQVLMELKSMSGKQQNKEKTKIIKGRSL